MRRTKEEASKTYRSILDSALTLFKNKGYEGTSISDIANLANVTRGAVYWHFKNKADIFIAIGDLHLDDIRSQMHAAADSDSPLSNFADIVTNFFTILEEDQEKNNFCALMHHYNQNKKQGDYYIDVQEHYYNLWYEITCKIIQSAKEKGEIPQTTDENFANLYIRSSVSGLSQCYFDNHEKLNVSQYSKQIMRSIINSLRSEQNDDNNYDNQPNQS